MFDKTKEFISRKQKEHEEEKKRIEESNANYDAGCAKNRNLVESRQKEATKFMRCPLCLGDKFFKNVKIAYANYQGSSCPAYIYPNKEDGLSAFDNSKNGTIPLNTYVCKRCGNIILKMDFSLLDDHCFREDNGDPTLTAPVHWDE